MNVLFLNNKGRANIRYLHRNNLEKFHSVDLISLDSHGDEIFLFSGLFLLYLLHLFISLFITSLPTF